MVYLKVIVANHLPSFHGDSGCQVVKGQGSVAVRGQQRSSVLHQPASAAPQVQDARERSRSFRQVQTAKTVQYFLLAANPYWSILEINLMVNGSLLVVAQSGTPELHLDLVLPEGRKRVAVSPSSLMGILRTPGAMYQRSTTTPASGTRSTKPSDR